MIQKEKIYVCTTRESAQRLFNIFKDLGLEYLDEKTFFLLWEQTEKEYGRAGFIIRWNTWQIVPLEHTYQYDIKYDIEDIKNL